MKIGLFFGSFNPIHQGHLIIAESALDAVKLDRVWFVVSPQNPFKEKKNLLSEYDRLLLVEMGIEGNHRLCASNVEFKLPQPSFTIDTLTYLFDTYKSYQFSLIMGEDNLLQIKKWKNADAILNNYPIYVYPRTGSEVDSELKTHENVHYFEAPLLDISATLIRKRLKNKQSIKYLMPEKVEEFILKKGLYM